MRIIRANTEDFEDYFDKAGMEDALEIMGFTYLEMNFYRRIDPAKDLVIYGEMYDDALIVDVYEDGVKADTRTITTPSDFIDYIEQVLSDHGIENVKIIQPDDLDLGDNGVALSSSILAASSKRKKTSTRDFLDKLMRVKSSNVWAYAFNPKDEYVGDMLMQFKSANGGPGDVYIYYDVPSKIWRRLVAAPSKGHAFYELIRHNYTYAKLTGDKTTKLPNGI
jgi:hypothetical protein